MRTILHLTLVIFLFTQTTFSQEINYQEVTKIVVGEQYSDEDVQIVKEEIVKSGKQNAAIKLLDLNNSLFLTANVEGRKITKACVSTYIAKEKNREYVEKLYKEVLALKKKAESNNSSRSELIKLNDQIKKYNSLNDKQTKAVSNYNKCMNKQRALKKEYNDITDNLYKVYTIKKTTAIANNN
ncbi:hypothetical protein [uncultured Lacinutrix sp.]|uniref:hypothetical protein n=1 Tax=uncultured Lacinutrix sp. TaxID=574032 RepID=UPI00262A5B08|nr:hypothetical protein [uncultured Lacinutrix sp.]